jgi:hypothetical protein
VWILALALSAHAEPLQWRWNDGSTHRYALEMKVQTPYVMYLLEERNKEVRVSFVGLQAVMRCAVHETLPKERGWVVHCPIEDASFFALPVVQDVGRADEVVKEYEAALEKATIEYKLTPSGRVSSVDLLGLDHSDARSLYIEDHLTRYVERAMSALDVALPTKDPAPAEWPQRPFTPAEMPISQTPMGSVSATTRLGQRQGAVQQIDTEARGALVVGSDSWNVEAAAAALFDTSVGRVIAGRVGLDSAPGSTTIGPNTARFLMAAVIREVALDETIALTPSMGF